MEIKKNVGIWIRVSTEIQVKDDSPEHHEQRGRMYAEAKGWNVIEVYQLDAVSGKSVLHHPETKRMIKDIRSGRITGLVFSKLARLARNTKELLEFADIFKEAGADLVSLAESIDTSTPAGRLFYTMIAAMAEWERSEIADRVAASVPIRAKLGKPLGGAGSYGYQWKDKELVVDANEAPVRKLMYELFAKHKRVLTVATLINKQGYRTRKGVEFTDTTVRRLLRDSTAKGQHLANYTRSLGEKKNWVIKPKDEWVIRPCEPVVSEHLWEECNGILDEQEKGRKKPTKRAVHLFTTVLHCECGSKMYVPSASKKYVCLTCRKRRIDITDIEEIYYAKLKSFLVNEDTIHSFIVKTDETIVAKEHELSTLFSEQKRLEIEMNNLVALYQAGQIPRDGFSKYYNPINEQFIQIGKHIPELQSQIDFLKVEYVNRDKVLQDAINLHERWPSLSVEDKRQIVEEITERIVISKDSIRIKYSYDPSAHHLLQIAADGQRNLAPADFLITPKKNAHARREQYKNT